MHTYGERFVPEIYYLACTWKIERVCSRTRLRQIVCGVVQQIVFVAYIRVSSVSVFFIKNIKMTF